MRNKTNWKYIFTNNSCKKENEFKKILNQYEEYEQKLKRTKNKDDIQAIKKVKEQLKDCFLPEEWPRNTLKHSSTKDKKIGNWQDSVVFEFRNISWWIYKEWQQANKSNLEYLQKKYLILKKYLNPYIPDSYFIIWDAYEKFFTRWFKNWHFIQEKIITIQRKIKWRDLSKITYNEKINNINLLNQLEKAHRKYVLLKLFIDQISQSLWIKDKLDIRLDLWVLSNIDKWDFKNTNFITTNLISPNIMFDWKNIYFIDFWFWTWSDDKEKVFQVLKKQETYKKWIKIKKN